MTDRDGMAADKTLIYDLDFSELQAILTTWQEPPFRALQVWQGLYQRLWEAPEYFSNLPRSLRSRLESHFAFSGLEAVAWMESRDQQTIKTLFHLSSSPSGEAQAIEAVLMRYENRRTLCISTQAGCAMGCVFCATGQMGFKRNLSSGEIVEQVLHYARKLSAQGESVTNVVLMGMGEPFHNYEATLAAIDRLNHPQGYNFGARRFTISTVGLVPAMHRFTAEKRQVNLAVSLHAIDDDLRSSLLPINRKYPLGMLRQACQDYVQATGRRITFEWALIQDVNDSIEQAHRLANWLAVFRQGEAMLCHVNIIPLNPTHKYRAKATSRERAQAFQAVLAQHGISCTIRIRRGIDIQAGCGQLATEASRQP